MAQALRLCPQAVVLPVRHDLYSQVSRRVMDVLGEVTPLVEQLSVDEAFLDVSGARRRMGSPVRIAKWVRSQVRARTGLSASVGVAATKLVAKLASAHAKPDGLLLVPASATRDFLDLLPVGSMWGVGEKSAAQLARWGIEDVRTLARTEPERLERVLGRGPGRHLWNLAQGVDPRPVVPQREEKSVGTERTFFDTLTQASQARLVLLDQCHQVAARLRSGGMSARTMVLKVRGADFNTLTRSRTLPVPTDLVAEIWPTVEALFQEVPVPAGGYRLLGVRAESLVREGQGVQMVLDHDPRRRQAERAADMVNHRWGRAALRPASLLPPPRPAP